MKKLPIKTRYVMENGIAVIRPLHPVTKKPMGTVMEVGQAWDAFVKARDAWKPKQQDESNK